MNSDHARRVFIYEGTGVYRLVQGGVDRHLEVHAGVDSGYILEDLAFTEFIDKGVVETAGICGAVRMAISDKDKHAGETAGHWTTSGCAAVLLMDSLALAATSAVRRPIVRFRLE